MSQLSFDVIKRVWPKSGLTTFLKSTPEWVFYLSREAKISTPLNQGGIGLHAR